MIFFPPSVFSGGQINVEEMWVLSKNRDLICDLERAVGSPGVDCRFCRNEELDTLQTF